MNVNAQIRFSSDAAICMVEEDGKFRCATQDDMDALPVGTDLTDEEIDNLDS